MSLRTALFLATLVMQSIISPNSVRAEEYGQIPVPEFQKSALLNGMEIIFLPGVQDRVHFWSRSRTEPLLTQPQSGVSLILLQR